MDPNATLKEIGRLQREQEAFEKGSQTYREIGQELQEMCSHLMGWLNAGGFQPDWDQEPDGTQAFIKYDDWSAQAGDSQRARVM